MSTKTTLKRIALVAVSALGFGGLSVVVAPSANAAWLTPTAITIGTPAAAAAGSTSTIPVTFNLPAGYTFGTDTFTVVARVTSAPDASGAIAAPASGSVVERDSSASALTWAQPDAPTSGAYGTLGSEADSTAVTTGQTTTGTGNWTAANDFRPETGSLAGQVTLNLQWTPDVAGTYTILVAVIPASTGTSNAGSIALSTATLAGFTSSSVSVTTAGSPTTVTLTPVNATAATTVASGGSLVKVTLGSALLSSGQSITLSSATTTVTFSDSVLTNGDFTAGVAYVNVYNTAEGVVTVSAAQSGTLTGMTAGSTSIEYVAASTSTLIDTATIGVTPDQTTYAAGTASGSNDVAYLASTTRTTQTICVDNQEATVANGDLTSSVTFTDVSGKITGKANATFGVPVEVVGTATAASRYACTSVTATLLNGENFYAVVNDGASATDRILITGETRTASTVSVTPTTSLRAATGSSNTFVATVKDQFGGALAGRTITISLVGRNAKTIANAISDASGQVSYTLVDAGTAGTTDTLTFTDSSVSTATKAVTITYGTVSLTTMTLTGGDTTAGVTSTAKSAKDIGAGTAGPSATANRQTITATLTDTAGSVAGIPVSWSISGTGAAVLSTTATTYSVAAGTATTSVYAWIAGTYTVTATAGGLTATAEITFSQQTPSEARTVSATASGSVITAKVVDRFGNPVNGATVYASRTSGSGYFGNGVTKTNTTTDANGNAEFVAAGGDSTFRISTLSYDAAAGAVPGDQTCAAEGKVNCPTDGTAATAFTATTVGTTTTAETGVGASFAPAGVTTVSVDVKADTATIDAANAANDAAAEAIDAANAATDAANLAAEAADAATVAAEEARDAADAATAAVEELATQVATLMAALKAQITTLANTVAKIAKKVKA